jgi:long-chain fatty acid transport protein
MKRHAMACAVASALGFAAHEAQAAAFALAEQGASGLGNAYAGAAAVAEDASTVWWNPAGMARLRGGKHFAAAGFAIAAKTTFSNVASAQGVPGTPLGGNGGDAGGTAYIPNLFFAMDLDPRWNIGLSVNVPFGLQTEYDATWVGRFQGVTSEVKTLNINPAVSYKLSDAASVGFGISYQRGELSFITGANYTAGAIGVLGAGPGVAAAGGLGIEGQNRSSLDGHAWGFNFGGLFNITPATRVGIHYRSELKYDLDGTTSFTNVPAGFASNVLLTAGTSSSNIKATLKTPGNLAFSVAHNLDSRWELLGDLTWTDWSKINVVPITRSSGPIAGAALTPLVLNFKDAWRASVGANYKLDNAWTLKAGLAFDQSPVKSAEDRTVRLPDNDRYWLSLGAKYRVSQNGAFDVGYSYVKVRDADINNDQRAAGRGLVNGRYDAKVHILGVQYQHTF